MNKPPVILFFDGYCHLCNGLVDWLIKRDRHKRLCFAPIQGTTARQHLSDQDIADVQSLVLIKAGHAYRRSGGAIRAIVALGGLWKGFILLLFVPTFLRDPLYSWVAYNRYSWFGKREMCRLPTDEEREQLLP